MVEWLYRNGSSYKGISKITVIEKDKRASITEKTTCSRCGGQGGSDGWRFTGWTCFKCGGAGTTGWSTIKLYSQEALDKLNITAEKRRITAAAKKEALTAAIIADMKPKMQSRFPEVCAILDKPVKGEFLNSIKDKYDSGKEITEKMAAAILKCKEREAEWLKTDVMIHKFEKANGLLDEGRQELTAALISTKIVGSIYGSAVKALFMTDKGVKVWGTLPKGIDCDNRGKVFKFNATIELKEPKFGFYKRPAKVVAV